MIGFVVQFALFMVTAVTYNFTCAMPHFVSPSRFGLPSGQREMLSYFIYCGLAICCEWKSSFLSPVLLLRSEYTLGWGWTLAFAFLNMLATTWGFGHMSFQLSWSPTVNGQRVEKNAQNPFIRPLIVHDREKSFEIAVVVLVFNCWNANNVSEKHQKRNERKCASLLILFLLEYGRPLIFSGR